MFFPLGGPGRAALFFAYLCADRRNPKTFKPMKTLKSVFLAVSLLLVSSSVRALVPPQFVDELFEVNPGTRPSRIILKYFQPVDKGFKVEIGEQVNSVLVLDLKDTRPSTYWEYGLDGHLKEKYELEYNENGLLSTVSKKDKNQNPQLHVQYIYSNPKNEKTLKEKRVYNSTNMKVVRTEVFLRDKQGRVSTKRYLDEAGHEMYSDTYAYNSDGWVEDELRKDASGNKRSETETSYDEEGRVISEIVYNSQGKMIAQTKYSYNVKGLPDNIITTTTEVKAERYTVEYTYDERGNWIQQIIYKGVGHMPETILVRLLTY